MAGKKTKPNYIVPTEAWYKKQEIWRHNSFSGFAEMARTNMNRICSSQTATPQARAVANQIALLAAELRVLLKERL